MPYTNTPHPSNTRTTVTIVLSIIFGVSIIPTTALATPVGKNVLYFTLENTDVPTLYQEVKVKIQSVSSANAENPKFGEEDNIYFIETKTKECAAVAVPPAPAKPCLAEEKECTAVPSNPTDVIPWSVVPGSSDSKDFAVATVIIKNPEFLLGKTYKMCYIKKGEAPPKAGLYEASYSSSSDQNTAADFTILPSIYTAQVMKPTTVFAGEGHVTLTITVAADRVKVNEQITQPAYLIPCTGAGCSNEAFTEVEKGKMASLCSKNKPAEVTTGTVTGFGTSALTMTFSSPATAASYMVCVPYCFKAKCTSDSISWALVNSNTPIKILPANPTYTISPGSPTTLTFTGTGLKNGDKIRILKQGVKPVEGLCPTTSTTPLPNSEYTAEVTAVCPTVGATSSVSKFSLKAPLAAPVTGQVCYSRVDNPTIWAPVTETAKQTVLYFTLENADVPTLYQEVRVKVRRATTDDSCKDPVFETTDKVYFIETTKECDAKPSLATCRTAAKQCTVNPTGVTFWSVVVGAAKDFAVATVIIKNPEFKAQTTYKMCYIIEGKGASSEAPKVYEASYTTSGDTTADFTILPSIYTEHVMSPSTVFAGQEPVKLTITVAADRVKVNEQITQPAYLIPCTGAGCSNKAFTEVEKGKMASLCSKNKPAQVTTGTVTGFGTSALTMTFSSPATAASYMVCVPYCFKAKCTSDSISWALVNSNTPIKILPANPTYTISPGSPITLTFTGTGLKNGDKIRILKQGVKPVEGLCPTTSTTPLPNSEYTAEVTAVCPTGGAISSVSKFSLKAPLAAPVTGQVCYSRADNPTIWAPVSQTAVKTALYFTLENADVPTLYQEVRVKVRRATTDDSCKDPVFETTDKVYFIEKKDGCGKSAMSPCEECTVNPPKSATLWDVVAEKDSAIATVIIKNADFTVKKTYKMCYIKKNGATGVFSTVYETSYTSSDQDKTATDFTVQSSIYTKQEVEPTDVYAGQGPVKLTITNAAAEVTGKTFGNSQVTKRPFLIPCNGDCSKEDKDRMASLCSKDKNEGAITTGQVTGLGTAAITTTFSPPATPAAYGVCVPYCFKAGKCESSVSWALVNSNTPIKILPAKPLTVPETGVTVPPIPGVNKSTTLSATAISSTIPAVLITSVVFLYLYNW